MKKSFALSFLISLIVLLVSCEADIVSANENGTKTGTGSLLIVAENQNSKTIEPSSLDRQCVSYEFFIESTTRECVKASYSVNEKSLFIENIEPDTYRVYVEGINAAGIHIVTSDILSVKVQSNLKTTATFNLKKYTDGNGCFVMKLGIPKNDTTVTSVIWTVVGASYVDMFEVSEASFSVDSDFKTFCLEKLLPTGSYDILVSMFGEDKKQVGFTYIDSLHVFRDSTSNYSYVWNKGFFPAVPAPVFDTPDGLYLESRAVALSCVDNRAKIYYTSDGSKPSSSSTLYTEPIVLTENTVVKAIAVVDSLVDSEVVTGSFNVKVSNPVLSIKDQSVVDKDFLSITTETEGARIIYTLDGSNPSAENGIEYTEPFRIMRSLTVKAIVIKDNCEPSDIVSAVYYDESSASPDYFFTVTEYGEISVNEAYRNSLPSVVVIPRKIGSVDITAIANGGFIDCKRIKTLVIPSTVTSIGVRAFEGCSNISSIDISVYVTRIDQSAFYGWTNNQRINDYSGVITSGALSNCEAKIYATVKMGTSVVSGYTGMENLYGVSLPSSVTVIANNAFSGCKNLTDFELTEYVVTIGQYAFNDCNSLSTITLPSILTYLSPDAFRNWTSDQVIIDKSGLLLLDRLTDSDARIYTTVPRSVNGNSVDSIPDNIGKGRDDIYGLEIPAFVKHIGNYAFYGTSIERITIPSTVSSIGIGLFKDWTSDQIVNIVYDGYYAHVSGDLTPFTESNAVFNVSFADNVYMIWHDAFNGMKGLTSITIPDTVNQIGDRAFKDTSVRILSTGTNVSAIGDFAFYNCDELVDVLFGSDLVSLGSSVFEDCDSLTDISLPDSLIAIGDRCFSKCDKLKTVNMGRGITVIPSYSFIDSTSLSAVAAPSCIGSFLVTVKLPLEQLIVNSVEIDVSPSYASTPGYSIKLERDDGQMENGYRVFSFSIPELLGIEYTADVVLRNKNENQVGSYTSSSKQVNSGGETSDLKIFSLSELPAITLNTPVLNPVSSAVTDGSLVEITCDDATSIIYTLDGSDPTEYNGTYYTEPIVLDKTETVKAIGIKEGFRYSSVASEEYTVQVCTPKFSIEPDHTYPSTQNVAISSDTVGAEIHYTLDGSVPTESSPVYTDPIVVSSTTRIGAIAYKNGLIESEVSDGLFIIEIPQHDIETPVIYSLSIGSSKPIDNSIITGTTTLTARFEPVPDKVASYKWIIDGVTVSTNQTCVLNNDSISSGYHYLEVIAVLNGDSYSKEMIFNYQGGN